MLNVFSFGWVDWEYRYLKGDTKYSLLWIFKYQSRQTDGEIQESLVYVQLTKKELATLSN